MRSRDHLSNARDLGTRQTRHESRQSHVFTSSPQPRKEMPILTPSYLPHPPTLSSHSPFCASSKATCLGAPGSQVPTPPTSPEQDAVTQRSDAPPKRERALKIPSVKLEVPSIQENMAATLAIALLGHVLFLKSQVPLCVTPSSLLLSHGLLNIWAFFTSFHSAPLRSWGAFPVERPHRVRPGSART